MFDLAVRRSCAPRSCAPLVAGASVAVLLAGAAGARPPEVDDIGPNPVFTGTDGPLLATHWLLVDGQPAGQPEATPPAAAREKDPLAPPAKSTRPWEASLAFSGEYHFKSDLDDDHGRVAVGRLGAALDVRIPIGDRSRVRVGFATEYSSYSFDNATDFTAGSSEPWDDIHDHQITVAFSTQEDAHWSWFVAGRVEAFYERGAEFSDSITGGGAAGFVYQFSDNFSLGVGAAVQTQLEDNVYVWPIPSLDWKITDKWRVATLADDPGVILSYTASDALTFTLDGIYERRRFRLDQDGPVPKGIGEDSRIPVALGVIWNASKQVELTGRVGADFFQNYEVDDRGGNKLHDTDGNTAFFVSLELKFKF